MTTDMTIVEVGDPRGGAGFVAFHDSERPKPDKAYLSAADKLTRSPIVQPPDGASDSGRFPVWGLVHVDVEQFGPHWCFTVQGRGGDFGRAGSCQFMFVSDDFDPESVWTAGIKMIRPGGRLGYPGDYSADAPDPLRRPSPNEVAGVLAALAAGRERVGVDGDPHAVAGTVAALLRVLPTAVIRSRSWVTYLLKPPVLGGSVVSGHWPAELASHEAATRARRWLTDPAAGDQVPDVRMTEAIEWIAGQAAMGQTLENYRRLVSMSAMIDVVAREQLGIRIEDIPRLLVDDHDRLRTDKARPMVTEWAERETDSAIGHLVARRLPGDLADVVFDGVLRAHQRARSGMNPAKFPPADERPHAGWHSLLAQLLVGRYTRKADMITFVKETLVAPGRPLAGAEAVERATAWLGRLGVSPDDPATGIFPAPVDAIVRELKTTQRIGANHRRFLGTTANPLALLGSIIERVQYVSPAIAIELLGTVAEPSAQQTLLAEILKHNAPYRTRPALPPSEWLDELLINWRAGQQATVEVGVEYLAAKGILTGTFFINALQVYADQATPALRALLLEAADLADRASATVVAPVPDVRPVKGSGRTGKQPTPQPGTQPGTQSGYPGPPPPDFGPYGSDGVYDAQGRYGPGHAEPPRVDEPVGHPVDQAEKPRPAKRKQVAEDDAGHDAELPPAMQLLILVGSIVLIMFLIYAVFIDRL